MTIVYVVMANDYPVGVAQSEDGARRLIEAEKEKQLARMCEVMSPAKALDRLRFYHVRSYEFEMAPP